MEIGGLRGRKERPNASTRSGQASITGNAEKK
jgi:hypothetical protein